MLFGRKLRTTEPTRMVDHINYLQEILEQKATQQEKKETELIKQLAALEERIKNMESEA